MLGCQPGAPQFREHDFPKKNPVFFEIHRTINTSIGSAALPNHAYGLYGSLTSQSIVRSQLKCLVDSQGPQNHGSTIFRKKKRPNFLKFIEPVKRLWVLYPSEIMHFGSKELLKARAVFERSINVLGWQPGAPKSREHDFQKKNLIF